jgi:hypothetical protein
VDSHDHDLTGGARPTGQGGPTSLRSREAVFALTAMLGDPEQVHALVSAYPTWQQLAAATPAALGHCVGLRGAQLHIPADCPPVPPLGPAVSLLTRYDMSCPAGLRQIANPPALLFVAGTLPAEPILGIGGAENPTMSGVEVCRAAGLQTAIQHVPLAAQLAPGCSLTALRTAVDAGGRAVVVMPHGFGVTSSHQALLEQVLEQGGTVVTETMPGMQSSPARADAAARLVVALSSAVLLAEVGAHQAAGAPLARAAVAAGRFLIVPAPDAPAQSGRYIAPSAFGSAAFASAKEWSSEYFGTGPRIEHRCANGLTPADEVVANPAQLAAAIALGCRTDA